MFYSPMVLVNLCLIRYTSGLHFSEKLFLKTEITAINNTYSCIFECKSSSPSNGNSVSFILNNNTLDQLREVDQICYHATGECPPETCKCYSDSNRYVLKYEISTQKKIQSFGCKMRFYEEKLHRYVTKEVISSFNDLIFLGNGFYSGYKESDITSSTQTTQNARTETIEKSNNNSISIASPSSTIRPNGNVEISHELDLQFIFGIFAFLVIFVMVTCCCKQLFYGRHCTCFQLVKTSTEL